MRILERRAGGFVMEHGGHEAPYNVVRNADGTFNVYDMDDHLGEDPVAAEVTREQAETKTWDHYKAVGR